MQFHLRDNIMSSEVGDRVFCPTCPGNEAFDRETMVEDNGWVIEYDMDLARMLAMTKLGGKPVDVDPGFVFDEGYAGCPAVEH